MGFKAAVKLLSTIWKLQPNVISIPREEWFRIIRECGGKVEYWCGTDIHCLRNIVSLTFGLICHLTTRKNWNTEGDIFESDEEVLALYAKLSERNKMIENNIMRPLTNFITPFEYTIPKILKNQSIYTAVAVTKRDY